MCSFQIQNQTKPRRSSQVTSSIGRQEAQAPVAPVESGDAVNRTARSSGAGCTGRVRRRRQSDGKKSDAGSTGRDDRRCRRDVGVGRDIELEGRNGGVERNINTRRRCRGAVGVRGASEVLIRRSMQTSGSINFNNGSENVLHTGFGCYWMCR